MLTEKLPIKVLTDYGDVASCVRESARRFRAGTARPDPDLVAELLDRIADELDDDDAAEVHNPNIVREDCRRYVAAGHGLGAQTDSWFEALTLARSVYRSVDDVLADLRRAEQPVYDPTDPIQAKAWALFWDEQRTALAAEAVTA